MKYKQLFILVICFFSFSSIQAQDSTQFKMSGFLVGYGVDQYSTFKYNPIFFMGDFVWQLGRTGKRNFFAWHLEPQFNLVNADNEIEVELGTNVGLRYYQTLSPSFYVFEMIGSGPHFITGAVPRQVNGYIFSDNWAIGFQDHLNKNLFLQFQFEFRHISNAGLKNPNGGINTFNGLIGLSWKR